MASPAHTAPKVVAFDIIDTSFQIEALDGRLVALGLPHGFVRQLYASTLRDAFALACSNLFQPFIRVMQANLAGLLAEHELHASEAAMTETLSALKALSPHPDTREAYAQLKAAGIRVFALSNGAARSTQALLDSAGMSDLVEQVLSVEDVKLSKPRPEVYLYAAQTAKVRPDEVMLVACHPWDIGGAIAAGLRAAYVARTQPYPSNIFAKPEIIERSMLEVTQAIIGGS